MHKLYTARRKSRRYNKIYLSDRGRGKKAENRAGDMDYCCFGDGDGGYSEADERGNGWVKADKLM